MKVNAKYKIPLFITILIILGLITYKGIIPLAYKAAESDLFMEDTGDQGSSQATTNTYTEMAFMQCNNYIKEELGEDVGVSFSGAPVNAWGLGNYEYLVNADISINDNANPAKTERYACRIKYEDEKDQTNLSNKDSWSILGISGIDEL